MYNSKRNSRRSYQSSRSRRSGRRARYGGRKNYKPLTIVLLVLFGGLMGANRVFRNDAPLASARLDISQGVAKFSLQESDQWTEAIDGQSFLEGDGIRTEINTEISLDILEGTTLFLDSGGEISFTQLQEKKKGKQLILNIPQGRIWGNVMKNEFEDEESFFEIHTPQGILNIEGATFDLDISSERVIIRVLKGSLAIEIQEGDKIEMLEIGERRKIVLDKITREVIQKGQGSGIIDGLEAEFEESEWNLLHLKKFFPQDVVQIRRQIEIRAPSNLTNPLDLEVTEDMEAPVILKPVDGHRIPATGDTVTLEGTAPAEAFQISVNGYTLTKFQPGDRKWSYFASRRFGTLVPGENIYSVVAITRDGKKSHAAEIKVFYEAIEVPVEEEVVSVATEGNFSSPVILNPVRENPEEVFVTSEAVLTISGTVDPATTAVEVNGFRLEKFKPEEKIFRYIANANYGNFQEGENTFKIVAFGPDDQRAETSIKVVYEPQ